MVSLSKIYGYIAHFENVRLEVESFGHVQKVQKVSPTPG